MYILLIKWWKYSWDVSIQNVNCSTVST